MEQNYPEKPIETAEELEFAIFCIENTAARLQADPVRVYDALTQRSRILNDYIVPASDVLHTQGMDYIVDDILDLMRERGVEI